MSIVDGTAVREDRETMIFNRMMTSFIDHHAPRDPRARAAFAADIASLMRQATLHQAEIYERVIRAALGPMMPLSHSFPVTIKEKPDGATDLQGKEAAPAKGSISDIVAAANPIGGPKVP